MYVSVEGLSGVTPVAQTFVLRRVLTGGISANSGRQLFPLSSTDALFGVCPGTVRGTGSPV